MLPNSCPVAWNGMLWARLPSPRWCLVLPCRFQIHFSTKHLQKGWVISLACLCTNGWDFKFSGPQRAEIETLEELKLSFHPCLNKAPSNPHFLIHIGKCEEQKFPCPLLLLERNRQSSPPNECYIYLFWFLLKYLEHVGLSSSANLVIDTRWQCVHLAH